MGDRPFEVIIDGGGPWGFRLQGGKDFGVPLKIARVTPGSKSSTTRMNSGDFVLEINGNITENLSHMEAQNIIKQSGQRLTLKLKKGNGAGAEPKVLTETTVVHSAKVDHAFNSKPRAFGSPASSAPAPVAAPISAPKFDPAAYARKKKEELEQRKKEQNATAADSEILKMINATHISQNQPPPPPPPPPQQAAEDPAQAGGDPGAFRMVYSGRDIHEEASPGSKSVISSLKEKVSQDKSGLNSESKVPSRVFQMLQKQLDQEDPEGAYHQDILDALKERAQTGATYRCIDANRYDSLPPAPPPPPPVVPINQQQRFHAPQQAEADAPPVDKNRVFKMTYDTRDIHSAAIPMGSMNVMASLKEKIAEKNKNQQAHQPKKTPSRLHAMLQDQYGGSDEGSIQSTGNQNFARENNYDDPYRRVMTEQRPVNSYEIPQRPVNSYEPPQQTASSYAAPRRSASASEPPRYSQPVLPKEKPQPQQASYDEPEYERFRSDQGKHIPSKVFQALQYCYPDQDTTGKQANNQSNDEEPYQRFQGNQTNTVPSKVFQALQYNYPDQEPVPRSESETMQFMKSQHWEDENVGMRSAKTVPSRSFKMLQKQYSDEKESTAMTADLQDALDLLEKELQSMTTSKLNPVITVPLSKGIQKHKPASTIDGPTSPQSAPPLPVRVDSKRVRIPPKLNEEDEEIMQAPMAVVDVVPGHQPRRNSTKSGNSNIMQAPKAQVNRGGHSKRGSSSSHNEDTEVMVAPLPHVERDKYGNKSILRNENNGDILAVAPAAEIVAYSAEIETPWINPKKNERGRTNPALSMRSQNNPHTENPGSRNSSYPETSGPRGNINFASVSSERRTSTGGYKTRSDSCDSSGSYSSQQDRTTLFDPDTYIVTRKGSINSSGVRSNSIDSSQSFSSQEPLYEDETEGQRYYLPNTGTIQIEQPLSHNEAPRKMVINVNGRSRASQSSEQQENDRRINHQSPANREIKMASDNQSIPATRGSSTSSDASRDSRDRLPSSMKITVSAKAVGKHNHERNSQADFENYNDDVFEGGKHASKPANGNNHNINEKLLDSPRENKVPERMPTPLNNLQEMMDMFQVDAFEKEVERRGSKEDNLEENEEEVCQEIHVEKDQEQNVGDFSKLEALQLSDLKSEEIEEVFVENDRSSLLSEIENKFAAKQSIESSGKDQQNQGKPEESDLSKSPPSCPATAVHVQTRKQQKQLSCAKSGTGVMSPQGRRRTVEKEPATPVNIQLQKSKRLSMPVQSSVEFDKIDTVKKQQQSTNESASNTKTSTPTSPSKMSNGKDIQNGRPSTSRPAAVRDDSIIVATEVTDDNDDLSAEKLQKTFDMINATADRILDQIDKVGSLGDFADEFDLNDYPTDEDVFSDQQSEGLSTGTNNSKSSSSSSASRSPRENGYHMKLQSDENENNLNYREYNNGKSNAVFEEVFSGTNEYPYRVSKQVVSSVKRTPTGVKITLPAFSVKVSRGSSSSEDDDLPPPPPELIDEEEPPRPSFGSSGPGVQSRTFRHLQEAVESGEGHQSVFSRPPEERNKAVPMPSQKPKPVAASQPQVTTVNAIPKPPMPSGPNFKISSPKAPSFKAASPYQQNSYRPTSNAPAYNNTPSAPSFKPSTVPQPVNAPQTTTNKAPSKAPLPIDPSRVPVCQSCNENIRGPFVSAIGKTWHPEHFCCDSCKVSLQNQQFVEEENKLYCQKCFANFAPSCSSCGETIIGNCVNAIGKSFHPDCFVCKSCKKHFANEGFMVEMGDPYCDKCHDRCFGVHCTGCDRTITGGQRYVEALGQNWHSDCFTCRKCQTRLEGSTFFVVDNRPFCGLHKSGV